MTMPAEMSRSTEDEPRGPEDKRARPIPWPVYVSAIFVLVFCAAYNVLVFDKAPHIHDEIAYLFQARIFLTGHFSAPLPCVPEAFDFPHMVNIDRWYSIYPPGFPFLLSIGLLFGAPWLVNPILGALSIFLFYFLGVEIYDRRTGILAASLGALSIWLLLMSATMMSHTASMFFNSLALLFLFRSLRSPTVLNGLFAGLSIGMAFLVRPYNAFFFVLPFVLAWATRLFRDFRTRRRNAVALILTAASFAGFFLFYNASTTGDPLKFGYIARYGQAYSVVFGRAATLDYDYTPFVASLQIGSNLKAINRYLFGWPLTSLWLLAFVVWRVISRPKGNWREFLLLAGFISLLVGFYFFWGAFVVLGARMFFDALPMIIVLSASGLSAAPGLLHSRIHKIGPSLWRRGLIGVIAIFSLYGLLIEFPRWVAPSWTKWYYRKYDSSMCGSTAWIHHAVTSLGIHNAVIVMKPLYRPMEAFPTGWWGSGFGFDSPRLNGDVIYANDVGDESTGKLIRCFPGRSFYLYMGTLEKGLLVPLWQEKEGLRIGAPITPSFRRRRSVELLSSPEKLFTLYSPAFDAFIQETLFKEGWRGIDVERLTSLAKLYAETRDVQKSAYALEAALQIEVDPKTRWFLLSDLDRCYLKLGQFPEAKLISDQLEKAFSLDFEGADLSYVIPARGF